MINWLNGKQFSLDGVAFRLSGGPSTIEEFAFWKPAWMVRRYSALIKRLAPRNIFELGIYKGGSCVFFQRLARASKVVAIDISEERIAAVDEYVRLNRLEDTLKPFYGVDQANMELLREIVANEFEGASLDLVIDDASHELERTRRSFNALFPYVRAKGVYVIEDWPWAHERFDHPDDSSGLWPEQAPLTKLIFEIVLACPSNPGMIDKIEIDRNSAIIWRGSASIDPVGFDISKMCLARGRALIS